MSSSLLYPLELNAQTDEPFLRLPSPFEHIIITPPREADTADVVLILGDPRVNQWLQGPPYPFLQEHADARVARQIAASASALQELKDAAADDQSPDGPLALAERCPVSCIREVQPSGADVYIGDCRMHRCQFDNLAVAGREDEQRRRIEENDARVLGDPGIVWSIGSESGTGRLKESLMLLADYLAPSHHRRGIMGAVCRALIDSWAEPRMNARVIETYTFTGNQGSVRVFEKNG
ncbi:hypothetical protein HWV62_29286 [Athelia sp. TMB]|nr:hypothetical protein HWV62_29286 [Athelia sp. TMB]